MKKNVLAAMLSAKSLCLFGLSIFFSGLLVGYTANAGPITDEFDGTVKIKDSVIEKKVDYLAQIYFSGKTKEDLIIMILTTLHSMEAQPATTAAVAKQYAFLNTIKPSAEAAEKSCDILELIAAGIYEIDPDEAAIQGVRHPSSKAKAKAGDAFAAVQSINSLSNTAGTLAWQSFVLSGGKVGLNTLGKVGGVTNKIGGVTGTIGQGKQIFDQGKAIGKAFGIGGKDKPCKDVKAKTIELGAHIVPTAPNSTASNGGNNTGTTTLNNTTSNNAAGATLKITIKNIKYDQYSAVASSLEKVSGISSVNSDDFSSNTGNIIVVSNLKTKEIVDRIIQTNVSIGFEIESTSSTGANLLVKSKSTVNR